MFNYVKSRKKRGKAFVACQNVHNFLTTSFCSENVFRLILLCSILKKSIFGLNLYSCKLDLCTVASRGRGGGQAGTLASGTGVCGGAKVKVK